MITGHRKKSRRSSIRQFVLFIILVGAIGFWVSGLLDFVDKIPHSSNEMKTAGNPVDAIVVLTGGSGRLDAGLIELSEKRGKKLFITGVYQGVDVQRLLELSQRNEAELQCCIVLDYRAGSTMENAFESAKWIKSEGYESIRLVTASYHMPRSLMEFHYLMPNIEITPHVVYPDQFKRQDWWIWPGTANLIISEYMKYLVAVVRMAGQRLFNRKNS